MDEPQDRWSRYRPRIILRTVCNASAGLVFVGLTIYSVANQRSIVVIFFVIAALFEAGMVALDIKVMKQSRIRESEQASHSNQG